MKILLAAGGTGGHINPALAIAGDIRSRHPDAEILFAGTPWGMEAQLIPDAGYSFVPIKVRGFERRFNIKAVKGNVKTVAMLLSSSLRAKKIIRDFKPDLVIGTGGYVSGPIVYNAAKMGIKTAIHEQNAYPGVTTKILSKHVDTIMLAFEQAKKYLDTRAKVFVTGNPVREEFLYAKKEQSRRQLGLSDKLTILSCGGSLGAKQINLAIIDVMDWHHKSGEIQHIHATGHYGSRWMPKALEERGIDLKNNKNIRVMEYIKDMPKYLAAADLIITRAGAITLSEIEAQGKAAILIPSPNVAENHQYHNAMVLVDAGAGIVIEEKDLTGQLLCKTIKELISDRSKLQQMGKNAGDIALVSANDKIYQVINNMIYDRKEA